MRVLLVGPDLESNLSLRYLASALRDARHEAVIATFNDSADSPAVLRQARDADLVGLSMCFQVRALEFLDLAASLKRDDPSRPVVAGGHYASCAANDLLAHHRELDLVVVHEGEQTLVELANLGADVLGRADSVRGVVMRRGAEIHATARRPILEDLGSLPWPDRSGPSRLLLGVPTAYVMGSRGCVSACDYCCITTLHRMVQGRRFRQRAPDDVADELAWLYHERGVRQFVFHDDNFLVPSFAHNMKRVAALREALAARRVRDVALVTKCSPRDADPRILEALQQMGLLRLFMGIESGSQCGLDSIGRKQKVEENERALETCERLGISSQYTVIVFHPEATPESMLADLDFVSRHPAHPLNYCRAEIYAGTPLEQRMIAEGRAVGDYLGRTYRYADARVDRVWELGKDLFAGRCWGKDELLGKVIRMDHQIAVLRRFYPGRKARALAHSFLDWEAELNLETSGLFRELVIACAEARDASDPALAQAVRELARREVESRKVRIRQICEFREALDPFARRAIAAGERLGAAGLSRGRSRGPRHAAALAVAMGFMGCRTNPVYDHGVAEAPPPPIGIGRPMNPEDAGSIPVEQKPGAGKKSPPPVDSPKPDAGTDTVAAPQQRWRPDQGVAEAAPPPLDERRRRQLPYTTPPDAGPHGDIGPDERWRPVEGVAEAAPPPFDRDLRPLPLPPQPVGKPVLSTEPRVRLLHNGARSEQPVAIVPGKNGFVQIGTGGDPASDPFVIFIDYRWTGPATLTFKIECDPPATVTGVGAPVTTPAEVSISPRAGGKVSLMLADRKTGAHLRVDLSSTR